MADDIRKNVEKVYSYTSLRIFMLLMGALFFLPVLVIHLGRRRHSVYGRRIKEITATLDLESLRAEVQTHVQNKLAFFKKDASSAQREVERVFRVRTEELARLRLSAESPALKRCTFVQTVSDLLCTSAGRWLYVILAFPCFLFTQIMANAFTRYIFQRLLLMAFVIFGVTLFVFTILYVSPMDPAYNILGQLAKPEQIQQFHQAYGLDQPYLIQLFHAFKGIVTLDPGKSLLGGEEVIAMILKRLPITMQMTFASLLLAVAMAVPTGILSALRPYSIADYVVMIITLIGLSMPSFWMGLILIYYCSIELGILPVSFVPGDWTSLIMPAIVLGTGMAANVARTTRSSLLEVLSQDYIVTAKAKGLSHWKVILRHALGNAMIPIVTVVGIQFGSMMSGATVVEKVFNINGLGNMLVERQFIPDIPVVLAGVVYIALAVSLVNLFVDILYAFLDPRIKAKIKGY